MVRFLAFFVIFFAAAQASASRSLMIDLLAKQARESSDLDEVHRSLKDIYFTSTSTLVAPDIREQAALTLKTLVNEAVARINAFKSGDRDAHDFLTILVGELGYANKSKVVNVEAMILVGNERMRTAAALFLADHFMGRNPEESYFPLRPAATDSPQENWESGMCLWAIERLPRMLAKLSMDAASNKSSSFSSVARATYKKIVQILFEAANDIHEPPAITPEALKVRKIRQRLAVKYLDDLAKLTNAHQNVAYPSPGIDRAQWRPIPRPSDYDEEQDQGGSADFDGPVRNCEGEMVMPVTSVRSTRLH